MKQLLTLFKLFAYIISFLIPKNKYIWVFGEWFGERYSDNSKYLFEYVNKNDRSIRCIWMTKNKEIYNKLKGEYEVYYNNSLKGFFYTARAGVIVVSTGLNDVCRPATSTKNIIQLWHGTPLKKIYADVDTIKGRNSLKSKILKFNYPTFDTIISTSEEVNKIYSTAFPRKRRIIITGYPRNDRLKEYNNNKKIITYLPTHRGEGNGKIKNIFKSFNFNKINEFLINKNAFLYIKLHFYDYKYIDYPNYSNIIFEKKADVYQLLSKTSILITDYSSVFFDFLLTNRPIIFTPFDFDEYIAKERELYFNYNDVTPGPKCMNWDEVLVAIDSFLNGTDNYITERDKLKTRFHAYDDFKFSERVYKMVKQNVIFNNN